MQANNHLPRQESGGFFQIRKWFVSFAVMTLMFITASAAGFTLKGKVTDAESGAMLAQVNILVEGTGIGTFTDELGAFTLTDVPKREFILSAGHVGYRISKLKVDPGQVKMVYLTLTPVYLEGEEVMVTATRADGADAPVTFSNLTRREIRESYYAQEMPMLLEMMPGVYSYSDAGNPQGYSYLKIRGFDQKRVTVMLNGIPLNDPEDHQVYWVDMPDLAANVDDIQVQRGLGYSPYGPSAFGGSVNIMTTPDPQNKKMELTYGTGSYDTRKMSALFSSGIVDNSHQVYGRFSRITSDGYKENSGFEGWSYFLSATRYGVGNTLTLNVYGGPELLHASWDGTYEGILDTNRTYNSIRYRNSVDSFNQPHYELHWARELNPYLTLNNSLFYIKGLGYWELYKEDKILADYGMTSDPSFESDLVQQKWVAKHQYGWISRLEQKGGLIDWMIGGNFNIFTSHHYDKIIWVENSPAGSQPDYSSYDYNGDIWEAAVFGHLKYQFSERLKFFSDLQFRHLNTAFEQNERGAFSGAELNKFEVAHNFINPKFGAGYDLDDNTAVYASAGFASREPSQQEYWDAWEGADDYGVDPLFAEADTIWSGGNAVKVEWSDPQVKPETMYDFELGIRRRGETAEGSVNIYWMDLRNEIIYGGGVYEGYPVMGNAERTIHRGVELEAAVTAFESLMIYGNLSYSRNTFASDDILGYDPVYNPVSVEGNTVPLFPDLISRVRISYLHRDIPGWKFMPSLGFNYAGKQYLESTNMKSATIDLFFTADLRLLVETGIIPGIPSLRIQGVIANLFDEEYETSGYYYDGNYYYPGPDRNYYLEMTLGL